jgi:site-specific DNA recombinase
MVNRVFLKEVFDSFSTNNFIGEQNGDLAYCYLRVSSSGQAEGESSGFPRQIQHIHEVAKQKGFKISWDQVFADDQSGFDFEDRPELSRLRKEYRSKGRHAHAIIIESLDRLSRNATWHQDFLMDEMRKFGIEVVFWKPISTQVEMALMGAVSQDGMEYEKQRMSEGNLFKARGGRITARTPAYGYDLVDSFGRRGESAKRDTHYGINAREAEVVGFIYNQVALDGRSIRNLAEKLERMYPPPKKMSHWEPKLVAMIVRNPVYKGEFIAHRWQQVPVAREPKDGLMDHSIRYVQRKIQCPREEWIVVPVPPIVDPELWERANQVLDQNTQSGRKSPKEPYLLTGLVKCAGCGSSYIGGRKVKLGKHGQQWHLSFYRCAARSARSPQVVREIGCNQSQISCEVLDHAVWSCVDKVLQDPGLLTQALGQLYHGEVNEHLKRQLIYLESKILREQAERELEYEAFEAGAYDEEEYVGRYRWWESRLLILQCELDRIRSKLMTQERYEQGVAEILETVAIANQIPMGKEIPFEIRQKIVKTAVDRVLLNVNEGWFRLEGVIQGDFRLPERSALSKRKESLTLQ